METLRDKASLPKVTQEARPGWSLTLLFLSPPEGANNASSQLGKTRFVS